MDALKSGKAEHLSVRGASIIMAEEQESASERDEYSDTQGRRSNENRNFARNTDKSNDYRKRRDSGHNYHRNEDSRGGRRNYNRDRPSGRYSRLESDGNGSERNSRDRRDRDLYDREDQGRDRYNRDIYRGSYYHSSGRNNRSYQYKVRCGFWNINGWGKDNAKNEFKMQCMRKLNLDIIALAETHLIGDSKVILDDFKWFGQNRRNLHRNAKCGSGGVGILVRNDLLKYFNVDVLNSAYEGILWLKFECKLTNFCFSVCACYLPPENSTYVCNHHEFFDTLSTNVYEYQKYGKFYIVGDFNARCGETQDYIEGVDEVEPREIIDYNRNSYGDTFLDFLVNINCCMLNGRQGSSNEFTYIEPRRGHSVVDYCLVPHEQLNESNDFVIYRATVLMQNIDITTVSNPKKSVSDHSLLTWIVKFDEAVGIVREKHHQTIRYDTRKVPSDF